MCDGIAYNASDLDDGYFAGRFRGTKPGGVWGRFAVDEILSQQYPALQNGFACMKLSGG
jgi:hypothetical protein